MVSRFLPDPSEGLHWPTFRCCCPLMGLRGNSGKKRLMNWGTGHSDRGFSSSGAGSRDFGCRHWRPRSSHSSSRPDLMGPISDQRHFQPRLQEPWMLPPWQEPRKPLYKLSVPEALQVLPNLAGTLSCSLKPHLLRYIFHQVKLNALYEGLDILDTAEII